MDSVELSPVEPTPSIPKCLLEQLTGCKVSTYLIEEGSKPGDGWMSILYSVTAQVIPPGQSSTETRHYLFKCYPQHPGRQVYLNKTNMFHNERCFYSIWVKALLDFQKDVIGLSEQNLIVPAFPEYVGGQTIDYAKLENREQVNSKVYGPTENFLVLTDLRRAYGYKMLDAKLGMELEHVRLTVLELATMHALSWAYRQKVERNLVKKFPFLKCNLDNDDLVMWGKIVRQNVQIAVKAMDVAFGPGNHLSKSTSDYEHKIGKIIELFLNQEEEAERQSWDLHRLPPAEMVKVTGRENAWRVICHGDMWCNNLLFKSNEETGKPEKVMIVDFQLTREGCPTVDLAYLLYTSTTVTFRRQHLQQVLQIYHDKFNEVCRTLNVDTLPDFSVSALERRLHRSKLVGYMMALTAFPMMLKETHQHVSNLETADENTKMDDMFIAAFTDGASSSSLYKKRILEIANELYDEGVI